MEIKNHHIVITGANRGIGRAVSQMCAEHGGNLHLVMRKEDLELKEELLKSGAASVDIYIADLSQPTEINQLLKRLEPVPVDILFNNAGQLTGGLLEEQPIDQIYSMLMVNVNALIHLTHGLLPGMLRRNRGKIINNSSVSGVMHFPCATTYSASKAAVIAFTNCLRAELGETKVTTLLLITPGVDTRMYQEIPKLYGKNMDLGFLSGMSPKKYAEIIREAILEDLEILKPQGLPAAALLMAQHLPKTFEKLTQKRFKRSRV